MHIARRTDAPEGSDPHRRSSIEVLYKKLGRGVLARCRRLLKSQQAAEDATHEVFVKLMRSIDSLPTDEAAAAWVHRIATNHCLNLLRDSRRRTASVAALPDGFEHDEVEETVLRENFASRVLERAPDALKAPAVLYHLKGMDQSRVASWLGISRRTLLYRLAEFAKRARELDEQV